MTELTEDQIENIEKAVNEWSLTKSVTRASEELLELSISLLHYDRKKATLEDVLNEMADVHIALKHLEIKFGSYQEQLDVKSLKCNT